MSRQYVQYRKKIKRDQRKAERHAEAQELLDLQAQIEAQTPARGTIPLAQELRGDAEDSDNPSDGPAMNFTDIPLCKRTQKGLEEAGFVKMTAIQRATLPHALAGRDVLGASKTGSGKTLAFLLPVLELLFRNKWTQDDGLGALILSPTRELAVQTFEVLRSIGKHHDFSAGLVIGGAMNLREETAAIGKMNILVTTPGRLLHHMDTTTTFRSDNLQILVLDEADKILDLGFKRDLNSILENLPEARQTLLFSATQSTSVSNLARLSLQEPEFISVHAQSQFSTPLKLSQFYTEVPVGDKIDFLFSFLRTHLHSKIMVFLTSQKQVRFLFEAMRRLQPGLSIIHMVGNMNQNKRMDMYRRFHREKEQEQAGICLFCTDIAARGLDFKNVDWVIQLDCPEDPDTYIHRVGRTARLNADGTALMVLLPSELKMAELLEAKKIPISRLEANPAKHQSIKAELQGICLKYPDIKILAQKSVVAYIKSVSLMKNKEVFDASKIPVEDYSFSLGLQSAPVIPEKFKKVDKNKLIRKHKEALAAQLMEQAEDGVIPLKIKKTNEQKLLKRKNVDVLAESTLKLNPSIQTMGLEEDGEDFIKKKSGESSTHQLPEFFVREEDMKEPKLKKQKVREFEFAHHNFLFKDEK